MWHDRIYGIADRLAVLERKMLELQVKGAMHRAHEQEQQA
jgi:hypothetical protein